MFKRINCPSQPEAPGSRQAAFRHQGSPAGAPEAVKPVVGLPGALGAVSAATSTPPLPGPRQRAGTAGAGRPDDDLGDVDDLGGHGEHRVDNEPARLPGPVVGDLGGVGWAGDHHAGD